MSSLNSELCIYKDKSEVTDGIVYKTNVRVTLHFTNDNNIPDHEIAMMIKDYLKDYIDNIDVATIEALL